jgi:hypothetical protein
MGSPLPQYALSQNIMMRAFEELKAPQHGLLPVMLTDNARQEMDFQAVYQELQMNQSRWETAQKVVAKFYTDNLLPVITKLHSELKHN